MLGRLLSGLVSRQIADGRLREEDRELYEYAYRLLTLQAVNVAVMIAVGVVFSCLFPVLVFAAVYIPLRSFAGGYHASTPSRCALFSALMEASSALILRSRVVQQWSLPAFLATLAAGAVIWLRAPVNAKNRPLTGLEEKDYRKKARWIWAVELAGSFILIRIPALSDAAAMVWIAHWMQAGMLIMREKKAEE